MIHEDASQRLREEALYDDDVCAYVDGVLTGEVVAGQLVRQACERFLEDVKTGHDRGLWFDADAALQAISFIEGLKHGKGRWKGRPFRLAPWQRFIVWQVFGWMRASGARRYQRAYIQIARKNGKSTLAAALALKLLFGDGEPTAEVYCAATKSEQARIVYDEACRMASKSGLGRLSMVGKNAIAVPSTDSTMKPLAADGKKLDGLDVSGAIVDELHAHPTPEVWDVIDSATGSRESPFVVAITTAGNDRATICFELREHSRMILEGKVDDDAFFAFVAEPDPDDDWTQPEAWAKGNPNLGVSVFEEEIREQCARAIAMPSRAINFRQKRANQWVDRSLSWISSEAWSACDGPVDVSELYGRECFGGLDMASKLDIGAWVLAFPPIEDGEPWHVLGRFFAPSLAVHQRTTGGRGDLQAWADAGHLTITPGEVIDYERVRRVIASDAKRFDIVDVGVDPWNVEHLRQLLISDDVAAEIVNFPQNARTLSGPMRRVEELVASGDIAHGGNPALAWMVGNVVALTDQNGNPKPDRRKSRDKIDGVVAMLMAIGRGMLESDGDDGDSVYEDRGPLII